MNASDRTFIVKIFGCLLMLGLLVYGASLRNDFVAFDDDTLVYENAAVQELSVSSIKWVFTHYDPELYIPLTFLSYQFDHLVGSGHAVMFHLTNLLLHVGNAALLTWIVLLFLGDSGRSRFVAAVCGVLFLVHPLNTETVAWISARKDLLSTFFLFASIIAYLKYREGHRVLLLGTYGFFLLGLLSKVSIISLPIVLLLMDWREGRLKEPRAWIEKVPLVLLAMLFGIVAIIGKDSVLGDSAVLEATLIAGRSTVFYLLKFILPVGLAVIYPQTTAVTLLSPAFVFSWLVLFTTLGVLLWAYRRTKEPLFCGLCFLVLLAASFSNYAKAGDLYYASDRYAYMPMLFLLLGFGFFLSWYFRNGQLKRGQYTIIAIGLVSFLFAAGAVRQSLYWKDTFTLFSRVLAVSEDSHIAHTKVGAHYAEMSDQTQAIAHLERSIAIRPTARAFYNLGVVAIDMGELDDALLMNEEAVKLDPGYGPAYRNLSYLLWKKGRKGEALTAARKAVELLPGDPDAKANLEVMGNQM